MGARSCESRVCVSALFNPILSQTLRAFHGSQRLEIERFDKLRCLYGDSLPLRTPVDKAREASRTRRRPAGDRQTPRRSSR
jgi:hypothetical protein